jgi:hypothetical protein
MFDQIFHSALPEFFAFGAFTQAVLTALPLFSVINLRLNAISIACSTCVVRRVKKSPFPR